MTTEQMIAHYRMLATLPVRVHEMDMERKKITPSMVRKWKEMHAQGVSYMKIADVYGVTKNTVGRYLRGRRD